MFGVYFDFVCVCYGSWNFVVVILFIVNVWRLLSVCRVFSFGG